MATWICVHMCIHYVHISILSRLSISGSQGTGAYPSYLDRLPVRQTTIHTTLTPMGNLLSPINLTPLWEEARVAEENPHTTQALTRWWIRTRTFLL